MCGKLDLSRTEEDGYIVEELIATKARGVIAPNLQLRFLIPSHLVSGPVIHLNIEMVRNIIDVILNAYLNIGYLFPTSSMRSPRVRKFFEVRLAFPGSLQSQSQTNSERLN